MPRSLSGFAWTRADGLHRRVELAAFRDGAVALAIVARARTDAALHSALEIPVLPR